MDNTQEDTQERTTLRRDHAENQLRAMEPETSQKTTTGPDSSDVIQPSSVAPLVSDLSPTDEERTVNLILASPSSSKTTSCQASTAPAEQSSAVTRFDELGRTGGNQVARPQAEEPYLDGLEEAKEDTTKLPESEDVRMGSTVDEAVHCAAEEARGADKLGENSGDSQEDERAESAEEEDEDYSSEEDEPPVEDPSENIRDDLEAALAGSLEFKGTFAFKRSYEDAPNPILRLDGLGLVGLPLTEREAKAVISHCEQAPFGKRERTIVDTSVRDTWEMDGSKVHFDNPAWQNFMNRTVQEVCTTLGVNFNISRPRAELYKLLIYEKGSHFLPHQDTEKVNGMFATIVVVLPSPFTGGAAHLSHGDLPAVFDCSQMSTMQTSVMAWYTDVVHEIKPVTSGYRLALSFNLIHTTNSLRPSLPSSHTVVKNLRHILLSWKQRDDATPLKIVILLDHQYSQANLRGSALKGSDAHKVGLLDSLAKQHGFRIYLASVECYQSGSANDYGSGYRKRNYWTYDSSEDEGGEAEMGEIDERRMSIKNVVNLEGQQVMESIGDEDEGAGEDEDDDELIPANLREMVESGSPDDEEYEGYQGNYGGTMERWYRRTVLLIWPKLHSFEIEGEDLAMDILREATGLKPTKEERRATEYMFAAVQGSRISKRDGGYALSKVSLQWHDFGMWERAVQACEGWKTVGIFGVDALLGAVVQFDFERVRPTLEKVLKYDPSNTDRYNLLLRLSRWMLGQNQPVFTFWTVEQRKLMVESLREPKPTEGPLLLELARQHGGIPCLVATIIPQVKLVAHNNFLLGFAGLLHSRGAIIIQADGDKAIIDGIVTDLLSLAISRADFFVTITMPCEPRAPTYQRSETRATPDVTREHIEACLETRNNLLIARIIETLTSVTGLTPEVAQSRAKHVLLPLIPHINQMRISRSPTDPPFPDMIKLYQTAVALYMDQMGKTIPTKADWDAIMKAVLLGGGTDLLEKTILPKLEVLPWNENVYREFIGQLHAHRNEIVNMGGSPTLLSNVIKALVNRVVQNLDLSYTPPSHYEDTYHFNLPN